MDNKVFNINGRGDELLEKVIELAFIQEWGPESPATVKAWREDKEKGLIFLWTATEDSNKFPTALNAKQAAGVASAWLQGEFAQEVELDGWDVDCDHDGSNDLGWRVYCEDWGHVGHDSYAIIAIKPAYMWYGK